MQNLSASLFCGGLILAVLLFYANLRSQPPSFRRKLKEKRQKLKKQHLPHYEISNKDIDPRFREAIIINEIEIAEQMMAEEKLEDAIMHFAHAISVCADPGHLLNCLKRTLPTETYNSLINLLVLMYGDRFNMKSKKMCSQIASSLSFNTYHRGAESLSEPDLTTADKALWNSGFPPGFTVDELKYHRRKRAPGKPKDHLGLEDGTFNQLKTEYKRRYKDYHSAYNSKDISPSRADKPDDLLKLEEGSSGVQAEYAESFIEHPIEQAVNRRRKRSAFQLIDDVDMALYDENLSSTIPFVSSENQSQFIKYDHLERTNPIHHLDHLKLEGDLYTLTENTEQFIEYLIEKRHLLRTATHLKMEGDMENKTEMSEQFVPQNFQMRPPLCKKLTNLHLEGDMDMITENSQKFVGYEVEKRRPLIKRSTNLHLEGDLEHNPEYRQQFIEFKNERVLPTVPHNNLKVDGLFEGATENKTKFVEYDPKAAIPFLRGSDFNRKLLLGDDLSTKSAEYKEKFVSHSATKTQPIKSGAHLKSEGDFETLSESRREFVQKPLSKCERAKANPNLNLEGHIDLNPEYRNAYVDFYKKGGVVSPGRRRRTYSQSYSNLKNEGAMEIYPEYKRSFVDYPRQRPIVRKPEGSLNISSEGDIDHTTEKRAQFVEYPNFQKTDSLKRESELNMDGDFICQPEYRKAYVDYLIRERIERKPRPIDNLYKEQKRAFEIVPQQSKKKETSESSTLPKTMTSSSSKSTTIQKSLIPVKTPTKSSSTLPRSKSRVTTTQTVRRKSISKLETQLFGPKIEVRISRQRARSSPRPPSSRQPCRSSGRNEKYSRSDDTCRSSSRDGKYVTAGRGDDQYRFGGRGDEIYLSANRGRSPLPQINGSRGPFRTSSIEKSSRSYSRDSSTPPEVARSSRIRAVSPLASQKYRSTSRGPSPIQTQKFSRGPSPVQNLYYRPSSRGPSPVATQKYRSFSRGPSPVSTQKYRSFSRGPSPVPTQNYRSTSRGPSPVPLPLINRSRSFGYDVDRTGARFVSTVKVEDLAYTPSTSPIPTNKIYDYSSSRKKWSKPEEDNAFTLIDGDGGYTTALKNSLRREQKWMPSWYSP